MPNSQTKKNSRPILNPLIMAIAAVAIIIIFIITAILLMPGAPIPEFNITDQDGEWKQQGTIAVFDGKIHPDSEGEYKFVIKNEESQANLNYGFRLSEYLGNLNVDANPFMQYRLKVDNIYLGDGEWHFVGLDYNNIEILPGSEHLMTLEWRWPFELDGEHNKNDTLIGIAGGKLSVVIFIWAEVVVK